MYRTLAVLVCCFCLILPARGDGIVFPDGTTPDNPGGIMIFRQGNQTTFSVGGAFLSRKVKVKTMTPEGPIVTRFVLPSVFHSPFTPPLPQSAPAFLQVAIPDPFGLLFIEGEMVRTTGTSRQLESPPLQPGKDFPLRLRAAFAVGDNLLIEDQVVTIRSGESIAVTFDGRQAVSVPLRKRDETVRTPK